MCLCGYIFSAKGNFRLKMITVQIIVAVRKSPLLNWYKRNNLL